MTSERDLRSTVDAPEYIDMVGSRFELVARMGVNDSDVALFRTSMKPGKVVPLHSHIDPECFYVLAGRIEVFLADATPRWHGVEAGRSLLVGDGSKHAVRNEGLVDADLVLSTNNRFARFLREAGRVVTPDAAFVPPTSQDIIRMLQVSKAYGYWNASPAESTAITG